MSGRELVHSGLVLPSCLTSRVHEPSKVYSKAESGHAGHLEVVIHVRVDAQHLREKRKTIKRSEGERGFDTFMVTCGI